MVGQVWELTVSPPSSPTLAHFNAAEANLTFSKPELDGGSNIQCYEAHIKPQNDEIWYHFQSVNVKYLSQEPVSPVTFGRLSGVFLLRVFARNFCGLGAFTETTVNLQGDLPFQKEDYSEVFTNSFKQNYCTFLAEFFFLSDHNDMPKVNLIQILVIHMVLNSAVLCSQISRNLVHKIPLKGDNNLKVFLQNWKTISKCKELALAELERIYGRQIKRVISISDTGGENNGSVVSIKFYYRFVIFRDILLA